MDPQEFESYHELLDDADDAEELEEEDVVEVLTTE